MSEILSKIDVNNYSLQNMVAGSGGGKEEDLTIELGAQDTALSTQQTRIDELESALDNKIALDLADATSDADAVASDIAKDKTAYVDGVKLVGTHESENIVLPATSWFRTGSSYRGAIRNLDWLEKTDGSNITSLSYYFDYCQYLESVKMFNTQHIQNFSRCFEYCTALQNVTMNDISNATNVSFMFYGCTNLKTLTGVKKTGILSNAMSAFSNCGKIEELDVSEWNVSNLSNLESFFRDCKSLTSLDLSTWDISNVTRMDYIFNGCNSLTNINISNWNTSKLEQLLYTFLNCSSLVSLDISNWNVRNVESMVNMFFGCTNLTNIDLSKWYLAKCTDINNSFKGCTSLSNNSLNSILLMCSKASRVSSGFKTLKRIGLTETQAETCKTLSNWDAFVAAGWSTGYES